MNVTYQQLSPDPDWRACTECGLKEIIQVRKALFVCVRCNEEYIALEKDMREPWRGLFG